VSELLDSTLAFCGGRRFFFKYISANDAGTSGTHQSGFYMPRTTWPLFLDCAGKRGENLESEARIHWCDGLVTDSRYEWYGEGTRSEYRLTRFGRGFSYRDDAHVGSLLVMARDSDGEFWAAVLDADDDIDSFLSHVGSDSSQAGHVLGLEDTSMVLPPARFRGNDAYLGGLEAKSMVLPLVSERDLFGQYISSSLDDFPSTEHVASQAREIQRKTHPVDELGKPDAALLDWEATEYRLFQALERRSYGPRILEPFSSVDALVEFANTVLNRRKSRAGKSLEHHLRYLFQQAHLSTTYNGETEHGNKPDFVFPGIRQYLSGSFPQSKLVFLGVKTTCKDRWRQILDEADRIGTKHLFTLQRGISANQLRQMEQKHVVLVVPESYQISFPAEFRSSLMSLKQFIEMAKERIAE